MLIATEGEQRVGFAAFGPDADRLPADPEPGQHRGHRRRCWSNRGGDGAGTVPGCWPRSPTWPDADGMRRLVAWVAAADLASLEFYRSAGWAADGAQRSLDTGAGTVASGCMPHSPSMSEHLILQRDPNGTELMAR